MSPVGAHNQIEIRIGRKSFTNVDGRQIEVINGLSIAPAPGALTVITGPSGCGKSTLLRIIAGLDSDFIGDIKLPERARLAMVFQEPRLLPWRNVEQNVRLAAPQASDVLIGELFAMLDLGGHRNHYPGELSMGLARRVSLARAFASEPDILLLDEPFVSLDSALAERLQDEFAEMIERRPVTSILVTHNLAEAAKLADQIIVLSARPATVAAHIHADVPRMQRSHTERASLQGKLLQAAGISTGD